MAQALQHLHSKGIAHMDVKPDNILTTGDSAYKLGDFGLARPLGSCEGAAQLEEGDSRYAWNLRSTALSAAVWRVQIWLSASAAVHAVTAAARAAM